MINWHRVYALVLKYVYICSHNTFRAMDVLFWPVMDLLVWGFVTMYMLKVSDALPGMITFLIAAVIMWNVFYRAQQVVCISFLEDLWSRNLLNIFTAPVRVSEFITAGYILGLIQATLVMGILSTIAAVVYNFNMFALGFDVVLLFGNLLMMGWALGMVATALIVRWGPQAEVLAWAIPFIVQPVSAVFYPVSVLPVPLQYVAWCVPAAHVFEGMRAVLAGSQSDVSGYILNAFLLNILYLVLAAAIFKLLFDQAREKGLLAKYCS
ncbi:MAG: ABC transporter permease [Candidatus Obscuribacterales bacterium]|nr:ABC transporter permease [Candidatus Obscuribacterales bacterium]